MQQWLVRGVLLLTLLLVGWGFWWEPSSLVVRPVEIAPARWPAALDGLRVAQLSDLHIGSPWTGLDKLREVVARTNAEHPDLIVLTGDYVVTHLIGSVFIAPEAIADELAALKASLGVFAVLGNHDQWLNGERVRVVFQARGVEVLENRSEVREFQGQTFRIVGIGDLRTQKQDIAKAMAAVMPGEPVLALTHNPDLFPELPTGVNLLLAGHTHGGQVVLPGLGRLVVPSEFGERYAIGTIREGDRTLFVSPGIGTSNLPVRFGVPPEISLITLRAAP